MIHSESTAPKRANKVNLGFQRPRFASWFPIVRVSEGEGEQSLHWDGEDVGGGIDGMQFKGTQKGSLTDKLEALINTDIVNRSRGEIIPYYVDIWQLIWVWDLSG